MTFDEVKCLMKMRDKAKFCNNYASLKALDLEISNFVGKECLLDLPYRHHWDSRIEYTNFCNDIELIESYIDAIIAKETNASRFKEIICLINEGNESKDSLEKQYSFIKKAYGSYYGGINFDENCKAIATHPAGAAKQVNIYCAITYEIVQGMIAKLNEYARQLSEEKSEVPNTQININNTNSVLVDLNLTIQDARNAAEDAGLDSKKLQEVNAKIDEIQAILNSKETKSKKWAKAGEILKWAAEQSIQIASFLVPLLCQIAK